MSSIKAAALISAFQEALSWACPYVSPGNTAWAKIKQGVDCSGLFTAAFRHLGGDCYHGSNTMARYYTLNRAKLTSTKQLSAGMVVYKWTASGGEPAKYRSDGLGDFHHVGLVASVSPLRIIHASSVAGKVTTDTSIKKWAYCGRLKGVDYGSTATENAGETSAQAVITEAGDMLYQGKVMVDSLNVREKPSTSASKVGKLTKGAVINVYEQSGDWARMTYGSMQGWVCTQVGKRVYVKSVSSGDKAADADDDTTDDATTADDDGEQLTDPDDSELVNNTDTLNALLDRVYALEENYKQIKLVNNELVERICVLEDKTGISAEGDSES